MCSENVTWVVLKTPVQADAAQFKAMRDIIGGENNRPVQPLNDREVNEDK
ncbi:carbonic anhydrase family protein [Neisseria subflava]|nr:carbonic anhydrase family protein [Neisseria subflava]